MSKKLSFASSKFKPRPGEDENTNPGVYGQALAEWIREKLIAKGRPIREEPIAEDWGWVVMVQRDPFMLWVGCGNEVGNSAQWGLFVEAELGILQRLLRRIDPAAAVAELEAQIEEIVAAETECRDVEWEVC